MSRENGNKTIVEQVIERLPQTFERQVIKCLLHSARFYRRHRTFVCPYDPELQTWRNDFQVARYNRLYQAIDQFWRQFDEQPLDEDLMVPADQIEAMVVDQGNSGAMDLTMAAELIAEIKEDFYVSPATPSFQKAVASGINYWLDIRASRHLVSKLQLSGQQGFLTLEKIKMQFRQAEAQALATGNTSISSMQELAQGSSRYQQRIPCSLDGVNKAIGGGFGLGESTVVAGVTAGGKTVMAAQLAWDFARAGRNVAIISTEQPSIDYMHRILSNSATIDIAEFIERKDFDANKNLGACDVLNVPKYLMEDPTIGPRVAEALRVMGSRIYCLDWSNVQHKSFISDFETEMETLETLGWFPHVVIVDWIGGGLGKIEQKDQMRLYFKETADFVVDHGRRKNRAMVMMAQSDKTSAMGKKRNSMKFLAECKSIADKATSFIGISAIYAEEGDGDEGTQQNLAKNQFLNCEKARKGPGGLIPVEQHFKYQRWRNAARVGGK